MAHMWYRMEWSRLGPLIDEHGAASTTARAR
jgi:hypothetical protein